jgi:hypothetical protein
MPLSALEVDSRFHARGHSQYLGFIELVPKNNTLHCLNVFSCQPTAAVEAV